MAEFITKIRTESGDMQIDYNALGNLPVLYNPNLLINSDFRNPINQRNLTTYMEGEERYGIDRWFIYSSARQVVNNGSITITNMGEATTWVAQKFETPLDNSLSYTITVNVGAISGSGAHVSIGNQEDTTTRNMLSSGINKFVVQPNEITSSMQQFVFTLPVGTSVELYYVKLEVGTTSTPFVSRPYVEELALCRRFFRKYGSHMLFPKFFENQYHGFYFDMPMREVPVVKSLVAISASDSSTPVGANAEVTEEGVRKFFAIEGYEEQSIMVESLLLEAEIF